VAWAQRGKRPRRRLRVPSSDTTDRSPPGGRFPQGNPSSSPAVRPAAAGAGPCRPFFAHRVVVRELVPVRWARLASRLAARGRALASVSCRALFFSVFPSSGAAGFGMGMLKYRSAVEHGRAVKRASGVCVLSLGPPPGAAAPPFGARLPLGGVEGKEGHLVDALAPRGDEGRGTLRQAPGSRERASIRGSPNGATHPSDGVPPPESIGRRGEPGELKHLSTRRKGHQQNPPALGPGGETPSVAASERGPGQRPRGANRNRLERRARAGDSPVRARASLRSSSRAGHVEPCPNVGGPPSKPKYSLATDSEPVP
jgi:hypothetical protein